MCPITLTMIATSVIAATTTLASGAGVAAAASAGLAAGSAALGGAGFTAALAVGGAAGLSTAAGSLTIGGAIAFGAGATTAGGGLLGAGAGLGGTMLSVGMIGTELAAFASIGQGIHQHKQAEQRAEREVEAAGMEAKAKQTAAYDEAARENRTLAEEGAVIEIQQARDRGKASNLMNRSDMQVAALLREADREAQGAEAALATKAQNVRSSLRSQYAGIKAEKLAKFKTIKKPSTTGLALGLGTSAVNSLISATG